ncbi:MAG: glycine cleavage T C-terminal barrel domain-containing protein [Deltaproteobacteria bacterium]|nr:glycine cleavage T C-terminal barrel domain-containing protein [Deltaproteobacteria bacterium]
MIADLYNQITRTAGLIDQPNLCWIEVKGKEARDFLHSLLTNDIKKLTGQRGCYALLLTPKGKLIADLFCYTCEDYFGIVCEDFLKKTILETLQKFIIVRDVQLKDQSQKWGAVTVIGEKAAEILAKKIGTLPTKKFEYNYVKLDEITLYNIHKTLWGFPAYELWAYREQIPTLKEKLNLPEIATEQQEILRIESATPKFCVDMDENTIPQEANLHEALSFTKGCYIGQEIVTRLEHRGHVGKQLIQLKVEGTEPPARGEKIFVGEEEAGTITSSCFSPKHNSVLALGTVRYQFLKESTPDQIHKLVARFRVGTKTAEHL